MIAVFEYSARDSCHSPTVTKEFDLSGGKTFKFETIGDVITIFDADKNVTEIFAIQAGYSAHIMVEYSDI